MTFQNIWPLFFLVLVPVIIFLYLLKQKAKEQEFSSNILWKEIYKNIEAKNPFEKLKYNILMYLQIILLLLLVAALMAPIIKKGGLVVNNVFVVIDNSASMEYLYDDSHTRLEEAKRQAADYADSLDEKDVITIVSCGKEATVLYHGSDKNAAKRCILAVPQTMEEGNLACGSALLDSLTANVDNTRIVCYTDTKFNQQEYIKGNENAAMEVHSLYSDGENCAVSYINYTASVVKDNGDDSTKENGYQIKLVALCQVKNYGVEAKTFDVSLYADGEICDVKNVTLDGGSEQTVYFSDVLVMPDNLPILTAELSGHDSLDRDNSQSVAVSCNSAKKVLLVSEGNVFWEKALSSDAKYEVYKSDDINVLSQLDEDFDLFAFDGIAPTKEMWKQLILDYPEAGYLFIDCSADYLNEKSTSENIVLTFQDTAVTKYVEDFSFGILKATAYQLPVEAEAIITDAKGNAVAYFGLEETVRTGVIGFDIHDTDLALKTEFPIFISQLEAFLTNVETNERVVANFPVDAESQVAAVSDGSIGQTGLLKFSGGRALRNFLLIIVVILLAVEWVIYIGQVHTKRGIQYLVIRTMVVLLIVLAMAGISISRKKQKGQTVFVVDVSDSMSDRLPEIEKYLAEQIAELPKNQEYAVVAFGRDAVCWQFMSDAASLSGFAAEVVSSATNIEKAVSVASNMFDENVSKQMVLITDGEENAGSMNLAAKIITGKEIELYTMPCESSFGRSAEVYIEGIEAPAVIHEGDLFHVTVSVMSNVETDAVLTLYEGRNMKGQNHIHVTKGSNLFVFQDTGVAGTIASYKAVIEPEDDTEYVNNTFVTYAKIDAKPRILLIEGTSGEGEEFEKVLEAANIDYDKVTAKGAPGTISELTKYKAVITLNVYYDDLKSGFAKNLETYVKDYAGGYICIGGSDSYALGNYRGTELEEVLPVNVDLTGEKQIPKLAMVMVIDRSGSMAAPSVEDSSVTGLQLAKQAAVAATKELRESDDVGILAFDDKYAWVVDVQELEDTDTIINAIKGIAEGGGTSIYPAVVEAYKKISESDAVLKHIVLLTDGQDENNQYSAVIKDINEAGITLSTVAVGSGADQDTLSNLAASCGGRYYYTDISNAIPRIFAKEVYLSAKAYLINEDFYPVVCSDSRILDSVVEEGIPLMRGYVATTAKNTADVLLKSERGDPILATWQCGLGKTAAWCSDGSNQWTAAYGLWDQYPIFWANIINYVITDTNTGEDVVEVEKNGDGAVISLLTEKYDSKTKVSAVITDSAGNSSEVTLNPDRPGSFSKELNLDEIGVYSINVRKENGNGEIVSHNTAFARQYSPEYRFSDGASDLEAFYLQAGGTIIAMGDNIWQMKQNKVVVKKSLTNLLLIMAIILFMADIMVRRLALNPFGALNKGLRSVSGSISSVISRRRTRKRDNASEAGSEAKTESASEAEDAEGKKKASRITKSGKQGKNGKQKEKGKEKEKEKVSESELLDMNALLKKKKDRE